MNRRDFLKVLGIGVAATVAPLAVAKQVFLPLELPALAAYPHFDSALQYGDFIGFSAVEWDAGDAIRYAKEVMDPEIRDCVPPQYRDKIEWIAVPPGWSKSDPLAQRGTVGWKYTP